MPYPFVDKKFTFSQPDGSQIRVKGQGDQNYAVFETLDGYSIVKDPDTGFYCYAELSNDKDDLVSTGVKVGLQDPVNLGLQKGIRIRRQSAKQKARDARRQTVANRRCEIRLERSRAFIRSAALGLGPLSAPPRRETIGTYVGLCLLIDFPDEPSTISQQEVEDFCNQRGYSGYGNNGSVFDYFFDNSLSKLKYSTIVTSYYTAQNPKVYYTNPAIVYGIRARELVKEALSSIQSDGFDFSQLTADDEGYVYAVNAFYAGFCPNNWREGLWPHSWSLAMPYELSPGRKAFDYQITDIGDELSLATYCHENGHMICDYPDLYDYGGESAGVGHYCLMCYGGQDEKNPTQICGYLKYKSGWAKTLTSISDAMEAELTAGENEFLIYPKNLTEYFIIENRNQESRDQSLPASGLAIWHVDELGSNHNEQMTENMHYEVSLEQADDQFDLEKGKNAGDDGDLYHAGLNTRFGDSTNPDSRWWDGSSSGLEISDISNAGHIIRLASGQENIRKYQKNSTPNREIPDSDEIGIVDAINFGESAVLVSLGVGVDITHSYRGDLRVTLTEPNGGAVVLHSRNGGHADDLKTTFDFASTPELRSFVGISIEGNWTLHVQDLAPQDVGLFNQWELEIYAYSDSAISDSTIELSESPGVSIPDDKIEGIERRLLCNTSGDVQEISVSVDITHSYIGDLVVGLISPTGTSVDLHNRSGGSADNLIKTYTTDTTPGLEVLTSESIQGEWLLKVADVEGADVGKLNYWGIKIIS
jgi:M6 family metalloprotease-like protein